MKWSFRNFGRYFVWNEPSTLVLYRFCYASQEAQVVISIFAEITGITLREGKKGEKDGLHTCTCRYVDMTKWCRHRHRHRHKHRHKHKHKHRHWHWHRRSRILKPKEHVIPSYHPPASLPHQWWCLRWKFPARMLCHADLPPLKRTRISNNMLLKQKVTRNWLHWTCTYW